MIKFKKMSTTAKVVSGVGVTAVAGVAIIPVINTFIPNEKSKVPTYKYQGTFYKNKEDAEAARNKFNAMSGLVKLMQGKADNPQHIDYKPLMAEFVSFVSKLFVVKVFQMDAETSTINHFQYDGMSTVQKQELMQKQIEGEIKYGDLQDMTSLVKYATAQKAGNTWMFTPVDQMMLSILGDGSGQGYSQGELKYAEISQTITKLKDNYNNYYKKLITDNFNGIAYSLVTGVTHHNDDELAEADHEKDATVNEGDGSGDEYTADLIRQFKQWGTLKTAFEDSKKKLDDYVSANTLSSDAMKAVFVQMVADNAVVGWNNVERYSSEEIELRDLLIKASAEQNSLDMASVPGGSTDANVIQGWNWAPSGDQTDNVYKDWQLELARDMQDRAKLLALHWTAAPAGAVKGLNAKPTGDGTGTEYLQQAFDLKQDFSDTDKAIGDLSAAIDAAVNAGTKDNIPKDGVALTAKEAADRGISLALVGKHIDPVGLHDDIDYTDSFQTHEIFEQLQQDIADAQTAKDKFSDELSKTLQDITPGRNGKDGNPDMSGFHSEADIIANILKASSVVGPNYAQNYNKDQVSLTKAEAKQKDLQQQIDALNADKTITPAPDGALADNTLGKGDQSNKLYDAKQIKLRDLIAALGAVVTQIGSMKGIITQAPKGGLVSPTGAHQDRVGLGDGKIYGGHFASAVAEFNGYQDAIDRLQLKIDAIETKFPGFKAPASRGGKTFQQLKDDGATQGVNTGEQYTQDEITFTTDSADLTKLQAALSTVNDLVLKLKQGISAGKDAQLRGDVANGVTPKVQNHEPFGDQTGATYTTDDVAYRDNLKTLKDNFPKGNPWWSDAATATSDEAYASLYQDWLDAINRGTLATNHPKMGDGSSHKFENDKWKVYANFFKETFDKWHTPADGSTMATYLKVIEDYITNHQTLQTNGGFPTNTESPSSAALVAGDGDKSGFAYMDLTEGYAKFAAAYVDKTADAFGHMHTLKEQATGADAAYQNLLLGQKYGRAQYQIDLDAANKIIDDYNKGRDPLADAAKKAEDDLKGTQQNGHTGKEYKYYAEQIKLDAARGGLFDKTKYTDDQIVALSKMSLTGNTAGAFTPEQAAQLAELQGIDKKIADDKQAKQDAYEAWNAVRNEENAKGNTVDTNDYLRYTKLPDPDHMRPWIENKPPVGLGDGKWYDPEAVQLMQIREKIKAVIATHFPDQAGRDAELTKIMAMKDNSIVGPNTYDPLDSNNDLGDKSGKNYKQWEIDLNHSLVYQYNNVFKGPYDHMPPAPVGAAPNFNAKAVGDGSGNKYDSDYWNRFVNIFVAKFKIIVAAKKTTEDQVDEDLKRKAFLEGLHLDPTQNLDPTKIYRTPVGDQYTIAQFNQAKIFAAEKIIADKIEKEKDDAEALMKSTAADLKAYETAHKAEFDKANQDAKMASSWVDSLDPKNFGGIFNLKGTTQTKFNAANAELYTWWDKHKGEAIGPTGSPFAVTTISMTFADFISDNMDPKSGSIKSIMGELNAVKAHTDGSINIKPVKVHPQEDLTLRDYLEKMVQFPAGSDLVPDTSEYQTYAFNSLFMMYKNAVESGKWVKPAGYVSPSVQEGQEDVLIKTSSRHDTGKNTYKLYKKIIFNGDAASRAATMKDFNSWMYNYFQPTTIQKNAPAKGYIAPGQTLIVKYNAKFFGGKGHVIRNQANLDANALGKAAKSVADLFGKVQTMGPKSVVGTNWVDFGDTSPYSYTQSELAYYQALKDQAEKLAAVKKLQEKINAYKPKYGGLIQTPKGWTGTASATHADPVGDGTGNDYSQELIDAVKTYFAYEKQIQDQQDLIDGLETDYKNGPQDANPLSWDKVKDPKYVGVKPNLNHDILWSTEEVAYRGADASQSDIQQQIDDLKKELIPDPSKAGSHGEASTHMVPVTAAPDGVKAGWNSAPTGIHTGKSYSDKEIDKRDELKKLNDELAKTKTLIGTLSATLSAEGATAAPSVDTPPVPDLIWHNKPVGDGSDHTYTQKVFDDKKQLEDLEADLKAKIDLKNEFLKEFGQDALDAISQELKEGMVPGMNYAARYSDAEIALRDNKVKLGTTLDHLHLVGSGSQFKDSQALTGDSIVGKNIKQVGIGDDNTYDQKELDLRTLDTKIAEIEQQHGLVETDMAHVDKIVYDSSDSKEDAAKGKDTVTTQTVEEFYGNIDLDSAIVGSNHAPRGDQTGSYYDTASAQAFKDVVALQAQLKADNARIAVLKANWKAAPLGAVAITTAEATLKANDPTLAGKHKVAVGDATGNVYKPKDKVNVVTAAEYVKNLEAYNKAKTDLETFTKLHPNEVKFFEYKTLGGQTWNPVAGRNWTDASFDFKAQDDAREKLKIGKTMVNLDEAGTSSEFGINRGQLQSMTNKDTTLVMYQGGASHIADEVLGSDRVRIGYVLNPQGTSHISADAPVLSSLEAVADYLQQHPSLAPDSLIKKFALLQGIKSSSIDEDIEEVTMTKDRFKTIEENYGIAGDK